jgi:hypothetical protein
MKRLSPSTCVASLVFAIVFGYVFQFAHAQTPIVEDIEYGTACGPIAGFVALKSLGIDSSLDEVIKRSHWVKDKFVPLEDLQAALNTYRGMDCQLGKISPQQLCELLKDDQTVVILALRKQTDQVDHAVCAVSVDDNGQIVKVFDYPELYRDMVIGDVTSRWDGHALVVRRSPVYRAVDRFAYLLAPVVAILLSAQWLRNRVLPRNPKEGDAKRSDEKEHQ